MRRLFFVLGCLLLVLPVGFQFYNQRDQKELIGTYQKEIEAIDSTEMEEELKKAKAYNQKLYEKGSVDLQEYESLLDFCNNGYMGVLQIPKLNLKLPIFHGTEEMVLSNSVGHMKQSSLPVGGRNTHSVLSGHRGLPNAQLFTRLDELKKQDYFFLNICGQELCYQIKEIQVVKPENVSVTNIQEGADLVSLVTCTPYGLNTHRLIVTGERVEGQTVSPDSIAVCKVSKRDLCCLLIPLGVALAMRFKIRKKNVGMFVLLLFCLLPCNVQAQEGNIELQFTENYHGKILYTRVATMFNGEFVLEEEFVESRVNLNELKTAKQLEQAAQTLLQYETASTIVECKGENTKVLENLQEGVYLLRSIETEKIEFVPTLVFLPTWLETEEKMLYDITITPKLQAQKEPPDTGQNLGEEWYLGAFVISFIIVVGLSCHKRRKCGTMLQG